jgi:hypothetical protein
MINAKFLRVCPKINTVMNPNKILNPSAMENCKEVELESIPDCIVSHKTIGITINRKEIKVCFRPISKLAFNRFL